MIEAQPGEVLVVDVGQGQEFGYWGEIMATAGIASKIGGLVITGGVRDSDALIDLGLPTFSHGICIRGTIKDPKGDGAVGEPVRIGGVTIRKGDLVVGDADGVVVIPAEMADTIVEASKERDHKEVAILERIRAGESTLDVYNL